MIKIIKQGKRIILAHQATCKRCGCIFTFTDEDIIYDDDVFYHSRYVKCPACKKITGEWEDIEMEEDYGNVY